MNLSGLVIAGLVYFGSLLLPAVYMALPPMRRRWRWLMIGVAVQLTLTLAIFACHYYLARSGAEDALHVLALGAVVNVLAGIYYLLVPSLGKPDTRDGIDVPN